MHNILRHFRIDVLLVIYRIVFPVKSQCLIIFWYIDKYYIWTHTLWIQLSPLNRGLLMLNVCVHPYEPYLYGSLEGLVLHLKTDITGKGLEKCTAYHENRGLSSGEQTEIDLNAVILNNEVWKETSLTSESKPRESHEHSAPNPRTSVLGGPLTTERNRFRV